MSVKTKDAMETRVHNTLRNLGIDLAEARLRVDLCAGYGYGSHKGWAEDHVGPKTINWIRAHTEPSGAGWALLTPSGECSRSMAVTPDGGVIICDTEDRGWPQKWFHLSAAQVTEIRWALEAWEEANLETEDRTPVWGWR